MDDMYPILDPCPICNGTGLTTKPVEYPDGEGNMEILYETAVCDCQ